MTDCIFCKIVAGSIPCKKVYEDEEILAFHEPPEYQPPARWFERLYRRPMEEMQFSRGVDAISGATLSTRAALDSVRKAMAIHKVAIAEGNP